MTNQNPYWNNINELSQKQREKGISKYGAGLEDNTVLNHEQCVTYLQEELVDGLMYCEHLKAKLKEVAFTPNDYQVAALRSAKALDSNGFIQNGILGLCGETGEIADHIKKHQFQDHELDKQHLIEELGDVCWYIAILAHGLGTDLETVMKGNVNKLMKRYPQGFSSERSLNREGESK